MLKSLGRLWCAILRKHMRRKRVDTVLGLVGTVPLAYVYECPRCHDRITRRAGKIGKAKTRGGK